MIKLVIQALLVAFLICRGPIPIDAVSFEGPSDLPEEETAETIEKSKVRLFIDNQIICDGMDTSYSEGYVPKEKGDRVEIILPLVNKGGEIYKQVIRVSPNLGETKDTPFVYKNYDMLIEGEGNTYCVRLNLELKRERDGGTFPITWIVSGVSAEGDEFRQEFVTYVELMKQEEPSAPQEEAVEEPPESIEIDTIPQSMDDTGSAEEEKTKWPKLIHVETNGEKDTVIPGKAAIFRLKFQNKDRKEDIYNASLKISSETDNIAILNESNIWYFDEIGEQKTVEISVEVLVPVGIEGNTFSLKYLGSYENAKGDQVTEEGEVAISIQKEPHLIAEITLPEEQVYVGDALAVKASFINEGDGKAYNVTVSIEADGLRLQNILFLGELAERTSGEAEGLLFVDGREGQEKYGAVNGVYHVKYQDAQGKEYVQDISFKTELQPPVIVSELDDKDEKQTMSVQWWITVGILVEAVVGCLIYLIRKVKRHD